MNKLNIGFKGRNGNSYIIAVEDIESGKYGEFLDNIDFLFEGTKEDYLYYHPYRNGLRLDDMDSVYFDITNLQFEDKDGVLYVRRHIIIHYLSSHKNTIENIVVYDEKDIDEFLNRNELKSETYITLTFKDKPYKKLRVYNYVEHIQYIKGIQIPTVPNIVQSFLVQESYLQEEQQEEQQEDNNVHTEQTSQEDNMVKPEPKKKWYQFIIDMFNTKLVNTTIETETETDYTYHKVYRDVSYDVKSPNFYDKTDEFVETIRKEISNDVSNDNSLIKNSTQSIKLKGKLIIDTLVFRMDLTDYELEQLSNLRTLK